MFEGMPIEIFRAGDYGAKGSYTEADLDEMVAAFGAMADKPPITLHHDDAQGPHGEVTEVFRKGKSLVAKIGNLTQQFRDWLGERPYAKRSVEIYPRGPRTGGKLALRALSFVAKPEVQGLAPMGSQFDDDGNEYYPIQFEEAIMPDPNKTPDPKPEQGLTEAQVQERVDAALADQQAKFDEEKTGLTTRLETLEAQQATNEFNERKRALVEAGLAPAILECPGMQTFMEQLPSGNKSIKFEEDGKSVERSPRDFFTYFLEGLKDLVKVPQGDGPSVGAHQHEDFREDTATDRDKLADEAAKFAEDKGVSFDEALTAVSKQQRS